MKKQKAKIYIIITLCLMAASSFSLLFVPLAAKSAVKDTVFPVVIAGIFWAGPAVLPVLVLLLRRSLNREYRALVKSKRIKKQQLPGIISFGTNIKRIVMYAVVLAGALLCVSDIFLSYVPSFLMMMILSLTLFLFELHCVIDGKYYKTYKIIEEDAKNGKNR